jgi:hypothetical protein
MFSTSSLSLASNQSRISYVEPMFCALRMIGLGHYVIPPEYKVYIMFSNFSAICA